MPLQYLTEKRLEYARQLICSRKYSKLSIKEIAWRSGFNDSYCFSRIFKKSFGISPVEWEKELLQMKYEDKADKIENA